MHRAGCTCAALQCGLPPLLCVHRLAVLTDQRSLTLLFTLLSAVLAGWLGGTAESLAASFNPLAALTAQKPSKTSPPDYIYWAALAGWQGGTAEAIAASVNRLAVATN